jgi:hypothetical protein
MPVDPAGVAVGMSGERDTVYVVTREEAEYVFPDMVIDELRKVLPETGRFQETMPSLMMVNVSTAVLSLPFRIIKEVRVGDEVLWASPA